MKLKKVMIGSAALMASATLLAGCGTGSSTSTGDGLSADLLKEDIKGKKITLMYWASTGEKAAMDTLVKNFEAKTGATVELQQITDDFQKALTSRVAGNNVADVTFLDSSWAPAYADNFIGLDAIIENKDDIYSQYLEAFKNDAGSTYAVPKDYSTLGMYINEDLLAKAGYSVADVPTDFDKLLEFAKTLQTKLDSGVGALTVNGDVLARNLMYLESDGTKVVDAATGDLKLSSNEYAMTFLKKLADAHAQKYMFLPKDDLGQDWEGAAFTSKKAAIILEGNWVSSTIKEKGQGIKYTVKEMPTYQGKQATMAFTVGYGISKNSKEQAAAAQFVNYATSGEGLKQYCGDTGTLPTRKSTATDLKLTENPLMAPHVKGADYATVWSRGKYLGINSTALLNQMQTVFATNSDLETAIKKAEDDSKQQIADLK